jgi:hypothetical protein
MQNGQNDQKCFNIDKIPSTDIFQKGVKMTQNPLAIIVHAKWSKMAQNR